MNRRPHIIAAKPPGGATSQPHDDDRSGSSRAGTNSAAGCGGEKTRYSSNVDLERLYASYADDRPDLWRDLVRGDPPAFGERLVEFFRRHQDSIGIACFAVAVLAGCYFAFQLGRGAGL